MLEALSSLDIITALAAELHRLFPVATVRQEGDKVMLTEAGVTVTMEMVPWPRVAPRTLRLQMRSNYEGFWAGAEWPFRWWKVAKAIDALLVKGKAAIEFDQLIKARKLAYLPKLTELRTLLRQHGRVYMRVTSTGDPLFFFIARTLDTDKAVHYRDAVLAHTKQHVTITSVVRAGNLSAAEMEALSDALTGQPA